MGKVFLLVGLGGVSAYLLWRFMNEEPSGGGAPMQSAPNYGGSYTPAGPLTKPYIPAGISAYPVTPKATLASFQKAELQKALTLQKVQFQNASLLSDSWGKPIEDIE